MRLFRTLALTSALALAACASATEVETVGGATAVLGEPVTVDIADAQFNIPFLLPQIDSVQKVLRDNGTVVQETYYSGDARVAVVEHVFDAWFNEVSIASARDEQAFQVFLSRTPMAARAPVVYEASGLRTFGYLAQDGRCIAFRFLKRVKATTGYDNDLQDPDTFVAGYTCDVDGALFVERFGFMSATDKIRVDRRNSI